MVGRRWLITGQTCYVKGKAGAGSSIVDRFLGSFRHLGDQLIAEMRAGLTAGGEAVPVHSAGLKLVDMVSWPVARFAMRLDRRLSNGGGRRLHPAALGRREVPPIQRFEQEPVLPRDGVIWLVGSRHRR